MPRRHAYRQYDEGNPSVKVPALQMTLVYVKLTKQNKQANKQKAQNYPARGLKGDRNVELEVGAER